MQSGIRMKTLFVRGEGDPPPELREIVARGSTEVAEAREVRWPPGDVDRVVIWNGSTVTVDDRRLRWPEDKDELRVLFDTGG